MTVKPESGLARLLHELGCDVFERGWLSSNNFLFAGGDGPATLVDTGYSSHAHQTLALVSDRLRGRRLDRIVNTHLHSDHCGGNAKLQRVFDCEVLVPDSSLELVQDWDEERLTFKSTGQTCHRFAAHGGLEAGQCVRLGCRDWYVFSAPGHDPDAIMLFEPISRTLISGDALWENRLSIIFPELVGESGFAEARGALDLIEQLDPAWVLPGHGAPFSSVSAAIAASRERLSRFVEWPGRHTAHAFRALVMFRLLEVRSVAESDLCRWIEECPLFVEAGRRAPSGALSADEVIGTLAQTGAILRASGRVELPV